MEEDRRENVFKETSNPVRSPARVEVDRVAERIIRVLGDELRKGMKEVKEQIRDMRKELEDMRKQRNEYEAECNEKWEKIDGRIENIEKNAMVMTGYQKRMDTAIKQKINERSEEKRKQEEKREQEEKRKQEEKKEQEEKRKEEEKREQEERRMQEEKRRQEETKEQEENIKQEEKNNIESQQDGSKKRVVPQEWESKEKKRMKTLGNVTDGTVPGPQMSAPHEGPTIWQGTIKWVRKSKTYADSLKQITNLPFQVSASSKDGDPELKADTWPRILYLWLMPKQLLDHIDESYLKNSKSVFFHPTPCKALESFTKVISSAYVGCVHFNYPQLPMACDIKVLILFYIAEERTYLGCIPNDQTGFDDRLRELINQLKTLRNPLKQGQDGAAQGNKISRPMSTADTLQGGTLLSQTTTTAMEGGQISQNVESTNAPQRTSMSSATPQNKINMQSGGITDPQMASGSGGTFGQQRPSFDDVEIARQQNLLRIQHLRRLLEAAQQQEAQYKSQLEAQQAQEILDPDDIARLMGPATNVDFIAKGLKLYVVQKRTGIFNIDECA